MSELAQIPEQAEQVPGRKVASVLAAIVLVIAASAVVVWTLESFQLIGGGETHVHHLELTPPALPFSELPPIGDRQRAAHRDLDEWAWSDRATRRVRMPADVAIERYLANRGGR